MKNKIKPQKPHHLSYSLNIFFLKTIFVWFFLLLIKSDTANLYKSSENSKDRFTLRNRHQNPPKWRGFCHRTIVDLDHHKSAPSVRILSWIPSVNVP